MFDKIPEWERQLGKVGRLRDALKIASEWEARRLGAVSARDAAELDDPIGTKQHEALCSAFKRKHNGLATRPAGSGRRPSSAAASGRCRCGGWIASRAPAAP